jgi:DNA-binding GntR family transcriptional regulator
MKPLVEEADGVGHRRPKEGAHLTRVNRAFLHIRDLIVYGRMAPGAWIVEEKLCEQLNMSRTPVHLALYLLRGEGYVMEQRSRGNSHMIVAPITLEDAVDLCLILARLEGLAGRRAAELPPRERTVLASRLKELIDPLASVTTFDSVASPEILGIYRRFHLLLIEAGSGPRLKALHQAIEPQAERYWRIYSAAILNDLPASIREHSEIIAALSAGDSNRLEEAIGTYWENGRNRLAKTIEIVGEHGSW